MTAFQEMSKEDHMYLTAGIEEFMALSGCHVIVELFQTGP